jgi:hypothetical protein
MQIGPLKLLQEMLIVSVKLEEYGFITEIDYDKNFSTDPYYDLKIVTYKRNLKEDLEIHVTDTFKFDEAPDEWKYQSTTVELVQRAEFQEISINKMWQLIMLIQLLS